MRTPLIEKIKVGDYYIYTSTIDRLKNKDFSERYDYLWSDDMLGVNYNENGELENQGPGVHVSLDINAIPDYLEDAYLFGLTLSRALRASEGKSLNLVNDSAWIIAAQDEHEPYWHTHRKNIDDPRITEGDDKVDATYSFSVYLNTPECGSPFSDLLFAHKEDIVSVPIEQGKIVVFTGDLFHKPKLVPKEFGWRYVMACDLLFED